MKLALFSAVILPAVVSAHGVHDLHHARQQPPPSSSSPSGSPPASSPPTGTGTATGSASGSTPASTHTLTFTLASTNPSAVPLSSIVSNMPTTTSIAATTTFQPGTVPTFLPNAPPLPDPLNISPANYPTLDKTPPIDSPEVQQWIQDVKNSGVAIPNIPPNQLGGCPTNPQAAADPSRCWWTCGGCVADDDITDCPDKMTWGLTYDDGPALFTGELVAFLDSVDIKATFFVVGSRAISYPFLLQEEYMAQHQIAVHTWSHPQMTTLSNEQIIAELGWSKKIIHDVLGVTPTFWRPPYGDVDNRVRAIARAMGLKTSIWTRLSPLATFDTGDFDVAGGTIDAPQVLNNWNNIIQNATELDHGFIVLEHDLFEQTVDLAVGYILPDALARKPPFKIEPIITCLNKPLQDAYVETNDNATNPLTTADTGAQSNGSTSSSTSGSSASPNSGASAGNGAVGSVAVPFGSLAVVVLGIFSCAVAILL